MALRVWRTRVCPEGSVCQDALRTVVVRATTVLIGSILLSMTVFGRCAASAGMQPRRTAA